MTTIRARTMKFLDDKKLGTTLLYVQIDETLFKDANDEFITKAAKKPEETNRSLKRVSNTSSKKTICCSSENVNRHHASKVNEISKKVAEVR